MELKVNQDNCLGCGICVIACPVNASISPENAGGNGAKTDEVVTMVEMDSLKFSHQINVNYAELVKCSAL